jgi:hypothetical protein
VGHSPYTLRRSFMRLRRFFSVGDLTLLIVNSMPRYGLQLLKNRHYSHCGQIAGANAGSEAVCYRKARKSSARPDQKPSNQHLAISQSRPRSTPRLRRRSEADAQIFRDLC